MNMQICNVEISMYLHQFCDDKRCCSDLFDTVPCPSLLHQYPKPACDSTRSRCLFLQLCAVIKKRLGMCKLHDNSLKVHA